jgi:fluoride exporter
VPAPHPLRATLLLAVAIGGAVGACARWWLGTSFPASGATFPWTTFAINLSGSVLLALLPAVAAVRRHPVLPAVLGTGVLGGFTTLSAYSEETRVLLAAGHTGLASAYVLGTLAACLLGVAVAERLSTPAEREAFDSEEGDR